MKKCLVLMAMAGVAMASCVNDVAEVAQKGQSKVKVGFDAPVTYSSGSRANFKGEEIGSHTYGEHTYTYPASEHFIVYAREHTTNLKSWNDGTSFWDVDGDKNKEEYILVTANQAYKGWSPTNYVPGENGAAGSFVFVDHYWPTNKMLSFAAYSPANLDIQEYITTPTDVSYGTTGLQLKNFRVQDDPANQYDLLFSERTCNHTTSLVSTVDDGQAQANLSYYKGIPIKFQHALSSIHFELLNSSLKNVYLTKIVLEGVKYKGHFNEGITELTSDFVYDRSVNVSPEWKFNDITDNKKDYIAFEGNVVFPFDEATHVKELVDMKKKIDPSTTDKSHPLLLIPQKLTGTGITVKLTVYYTVDGSPQDCPVILGTQTGKLGDASVTVDEWEIGKRYTYRLVYTEESLKKDVIYFAPQTSNWEEVGNIVINLE